MHQDIKNSAERLALLSPKTDLLCEFTPKLKIGVMASGRGSNFEALVNACKHSKLDATIKLLIVNKSNCLAIKRAERLNIPYKVINENEYSTREDHDDEIVKVFKNYEVEGIVMAGWMRIVTKNLINAYPNRLLNIHPSILPSFKGMHAIQQALSAGVKISGCSVHVVGREVDSGSLIIQAAVPVLESDTKETLLKRIQIQEHRILPIGVSIAGKRWREK